MFTLRILLQLLGLAAFALPSWADTHIYAGALRTNENGKCFFTNGGLFDAAASRVALPQILRTNGLNAGYYRGDALTFSALVAIFMVACSPPAHPGSTSWAFA